VHWLANRPEMIGDPKLHHGLDSQRFIVSGPMGETEIDRLIKKLELDKEIFEAEEVSAHLGREYKERTES
jgi:hypothetical protein